MLDLLLQKCRSTPPEECHSIAEQIIPIKTRCPARQYLPNKSNKWGIKVWTRCGLSGFLYDFDVYLGKQEEIALAKQFGKIGAVVMKLVEHLPQNAGLHGQLV